jgi:hypothetical protein
MNVIHYIGLGVHKKTTSYCIKTADGRIVREGKLQATRITLRSWAEGLREPWCGAMEATLFSAWIYDTLKPYAQRLVMGHPARMKAITAGKKKSDTIDARTIADLLRCDLLPTCYMLPPEMRDLRRLLRYRNMVVQQSVRMQNKMAGLLMESGTTFVKDKLHGKKYFSELLEGLEEVPESVKDLLRMSRGIDLGVGGIGPTSLLLDRGRSQLLWLNCGVSIVGRQRATWPNLQTKKRLAPNCSDRSGQAGAALESAAGRTACQTVRTGPSQSGYPASGAKAGCLSAGCGQKRSTLPGSESAANSRKLHENKKKKASLDSQSRLAADLPSFRPVSDPPAGPRVMRDCAREPKLPKHPIVCFEAGRFALTQSSRPTLTQRCSRKWMSGPAAYALVLLEDPGQFDTQKLYPSGEHLPPSRGESPLPLDCYLSWMSRKAPVPKSSRKAPKSSSWFRSLNDVRNTLANWRREYNEDRPHSSLDYRTPEQ